MDINLFKFCSGLKVLGYFMILLVVSIVAVSYFAVVVLTWGPQLLRGGIHSFLAFSILFLFHVLLILLTWSYFMVVFKNPGSVPENWRAVTEEDNMEAGSSMASSHHVEPETFASSDGLERKRVGYCSQCQNGKPPRCHHCSIFMHASLVSSNTTSVEVYEKKKSVRWRYDVGRKNNFEQVFGTKKALWLLPMFSKEDLDKIPALQGLEFPTRSDVEA